MSKSDGVFGVADADVVVEHVLRPRPPRPRISDLMRMPLSAPSMERSVTRMWCPAPPSVSLPMDMPWPV